MSIPYTTRTVAKSIAEDTVKERFAKPHNFGEVNENIDTFLLDHDLEPGFYVVVIEDSTDGDCYTFMLTAQTSGLQSFATIKSLVTDNEVSVSWGPSDKNHVTLYPNSQLSGGTTIKLFKLD